jgi:hypothetical protein
MKATLGSLLILVAMLAVPAAAADIGDLTGTWSGSWVPKGGVMDALTVEIRQENGKLTGKFLTPIPMDFSNVTFNAKTDSVVLEAADPKSGKRYKIDAKISGKELRGSLVAGDATGELLLIKWTYIPR